uniref:LIM zinc-binding domain-containing protein n=1 Tax=Anopheles merus TaxID=30066 RepID=A0A182VHP5_ANOME
MANKAAFVGVPKRASCNRCSNPIFLAERISFGEKSYHRSCLKCARCGTQLTVGSFYETETDGEYCCETCPDEEIQLEQRRESSASPDGSSANVTGDGTPVAAAAASIGLPKNVRSSKLLDRISFFESAPLSDEEKSSNLERKARMSHFLKESLKTVEQDNDEPPDLPLTGPPSSVTNDSLNGKEEEDTDDSDSDNVDDVEDEFEKLVQDLDEPDLDIMNEEESTIPTDTPEACNKVDNDEGLPAVSTQEDGNEQEQYPSDLNPFGDEDDGEGREQIVELRKVPAGGKPVPTLRRVSTNPFGSEDEDEDVQQSPSSKPPRPPPPKVLQSPSSGGSSSKPVPANPFDEDDDDEPTDEPEIVPVSKPSPRRTPVPTPRKAHAYNDSISSLDNSLMSSSRLSSSNVSLTSSLESGPSSLIVPKRKKGKAPDIPLAVSGASTPIVSQQQQQMGVSSAVRTSVENLSNSSGSGTLTTPRKKRLAPAPPPVPNSSSTPKQSSTLQVREEGGLTRVPSQRLLSVDASLLSNNDRDMSETMSRGTSNESVVYRRTIVPLVLDDDGPESPVHLDGTTNTSGRQWEKMKDNKEAQNRNRQSQSSPTSEATSNSFGSPGGNLSILSNKSSQGKWKRRKGPAPALPMMAAPLPERKPIKMLPLKEIHQELQIIETQQQGLEKQGIVLETMIRERCEGVEADVDLDIRLQPNSKEVEDLLMQLFELVNEKNELFRRQAELMYLRRMHRLEQEQADLEYEIRLLMAQPERNKTDSDKEKEEALITRLVESIKQSIEERAASQQSKHSKKDSSASSTTLPLTDAEKRDSSTKLSKKEKKKLKEAKKLVKSKKIDSEKVRPCLVTVYQAFTFTSVGVGTSVGARAPCCCCPGSKGSARTGHWEQCSSCGRVMQPQQEPGGDIGDEIVAMPLDDCK